MREYKFEVGKKYKYRNVEGWVKFLIYVPEAYSRYRCIFIDTDGDIRLRDEAGRIHPAEESPFDILPEEYTEPFVPKIGEWRRRDGSIDYVIAFKFCSKHPVYGFKCSYTNTGRISTNKTLSGGDLVEYIGPLPEHMTDWEAFQKHCRESEK